MDPAAALDAPTLASHSESDFYVEGQLNDPRTVGNTPSGLFAAPVHQQKSMTQRQGGSACDMLDGTGRQAA